MTLLSNAQKRVADWRNHGGLDRLYGVASEYVQMTDELARAEKMSEAVEKSRRLHFQSTRIPSRDYHRCVTCHTPWPCMTARTLDA